MSKITIIEGNSNDKDNMRIYFVKGEQGYSAYDLYVQNGGTLTEEQWLDEFINATNFYNKSETDALLGNKANSSDVYAKTDVYTKTEINNLDTPLLRVTGFNTKGREYLNANKKELNYITY